MKKIFTLIAIVLFVTGGLNGQVWRQVTESSYPIISDLFFLNSTEGWFCANTGRVMKTTNGGESWEEKSISTTENIISIVFINTNTGFAAGGKKIFKTTDGGENWTEKEISIASSNIVAAYFADANTGWVATSQTLSGVDAGQILKTVDGGNSWSISIEVAKNIQDMTFRGTRGLFCGGGVGKIHVYYTHDGTNWAQGTNPQLPSGYTRTDIRGVYFQDDNNCYGIGWGSNVGAQPTILLKSTDGGVSWQYMSQSAENRVYDNMYGIYFKDAVNGVAFGGASKGTVFLKTSDAGVNWIPSEVPCGVSIKDVCGFGDILYISGSGGVIMKSTDFGTTWRLLTPVPSCNLYTITAPTNNFIASAGYSALLLRTKDGGKQGLASFIRANNCSPHVNDIYFVNENVGYAAHSYGLISKTTDGGDTWIAVMKDTNAVAVSLAGVFFLNENLGWVIGKVANNVDVIHKTTDGGTTWTSQSNMLQSNGRAVSFFDGNKGIMVGEKLKAAYTTDGGTTWVASVFSSLPPGTTTPALKNVIFRDANNAVAVGDNLILLSADGGATWDYSPVANLVESISGVGFQNVLNGWAVGSKTTSIKSTGVYQTTDGGANWTNRVDYGVFDTTIALYEIAITPGGDLWVSAISGIIYTTAIINGLDDELTGVKDFSLSQNYPNPFNPTTSIKYSINSGSMVTLKVYDILGRELITLVNEEKTAGNHEITFNAKDLSSGIYIYTLVTPQGVTSRKMSLIK